MLKLALTLAMAIALSGAAACSPQTQGAPPPPGGREVFTEQAVFVSGRLWLRDYGDALWSVDPAAHAAKRESPPGNEPVLGLCAQEEDLVAVTGAGATPKTFTLLRWHAGGWSKIAAAPSLGETLVGLGCGADGPLLLTSRRLIVPGPAGFTIVGLTGLSMTRRVVVRGAPGSRDYIYEQRPTLPLEYGRPKTAMLLTSTDVLVGFDNGEWGGGLRRIDRRTGRIVNVEKMIDDDICGSPLDSDCDPVLGIAPAPAARGCYWAAIGQRHMLSRGSIVAICGDKVRTVYSSRPPGLLAPRQWSEAFEGLVATKGKVIAVSEDRLTVFPSMRRPRRHGLPDFEWYGPFEISFEHPDMVLVRRTYWNGGAWSRSLAAVTAR